MKTRFLAWLGVIALVIGADQWSKYAILQHFAYGEMLRMTDFFDLVLVFNKGAAFSFLANNEGWQRWFFVGLAAVICSWLARMLWQHQAERLQPLAFALVIGGAIGNVIDRLVHGAVVDFLFFHAGSHGWPAFNVADSAICLGVGLIIVSQWREGQRAKHSSAEQK